MSSENKNFARGENFFAVFVTESGVTEQAYVENKLLDIFLNIPFFLKFTSECVAAIT